MKIELKTIKAEQKDILNNLMEKYLYEFSQYDMIPFDENGLFNDPHLSDYFTDKTRFPFFIYADGKLAGFALVFKRAECPAPCDWGVAEFFVAYGYRRMGVGTAVMKMLFERFRGIWQIKYHSKNKGSELFWQKVANEAASGQVEVYRGNEDYCDGTPAKVLVFKV